MATVRGDTRPATTARRWWTHDADDDDDELEVVVDGQARARSSLPLDSNRWLTKRCQVRMSNGTKTHWPETLINALESALRSLFPLPLTPLQPLSALHALRLRFVFGLSYGLSARVLGPGQMDVANDLPTTSNLFDHRTRCVCAICELSRTVQPVRCFNEL